MPPKRTFTSQTRKASSNKRVAKKGKTAPAKASPPPSTLNDDPNSPIYFWKPHEEPYGAFGQWYEKPMSAPMLTFSQHLPKSPPVPIIAPPSAETGPPKSMTFNTTEQWMMAHKALLFSPDDDTYLNEILETTNPSTQRSLGRLIPNFDEEVWKQHRYEIVKWGNYYKFTQDEGLKRLLLDSGEREVVEASPRDRIWGVGYGAKNAGKNREKWGLNLLGKVLIEVRDLIRKEEEERLRNEQEVEECCLNETEKETVDTTVEDK